MKVCTKCKESKPVDAFGPHTHGKDGLRSQCKTCISERSRTHHAVNSERILAKAREHYNANKATYAARGKRYYATNKNEISLRLIEKQYGLTAEVYRAMVEAGCRICGSSDNPHVDHDHTCCPGDKTCGKCVRGILCAKHNVGLGAFNDSVAELKKAIAYLEGNL